MSDQETFKLPDGTVVTTGCMVPSPAERAMVANLPTYGEEFFLDPKDIEKSLKGDVYKTMRKRRQRWPINQANLGKCNASASVGAFHNRRDLDGYAVQGRGPGNHATLFHGGKWVGGQDLVHPDIQNSWGPSQDPMYGIQVNRRTKET